MKSEATIAAADLLACENIQAELMFQKTQYKNQIQSFLDGTLLEREVPPDLQKCAHAFLAQRDENDKKRGPRQAAGP